MPVDQTRTEVPARKVRPLSARIIDLPPALITLRYLVLSTPRSGSTMLCSVLAASGVAGRPEEYLSRRSIARWKRRSGHWSLEEFLNDYQRRRTTANGRFGIKLHATQFADLFDKQIEPGQPGVRFLQSFDRFIMCFRRDKIDQAISDVLANERGVWQTFKGEVPDFPERHFERRDVETISLQIARIAGEERFWRETVDKLELAAIEVTYEDLVTGPQQELARIFEHLEVPHTDVAMPTTKRLANQANKELKAGYLAALGLPEGP